MTVRKFDADELHWYALDVVRQKEYVAGYLLGKQGCVTFIPTDTRFRKKTRHTKGKMEVANPALPGTIFVGFPAEPNWYLVRGLHLVNGVLSVPDAEGRLYPRRISTASKEWMQYRGHQLDGHLVLERHKILYRGEEVERTAALIYVQGKGVIRTNSAMKVKAASSRPLVIRAAGERARIIGAMLELANNTKKAA